MAIEDRTQAAGAANRPAPVLVDLGKKSKKLVRRLRKGKGKLMDSVAATVQELQASGQIGPQVQPVIVVVSEKSDRMLRFFKV
jgi:hypothetical protein